MKKISARLAASVCLLLMLVGSAMAATSIRITVEGSRQGKFKIDVLRRNETPVVRYQYTVSSPRDAATGMATGKRQHSPVVITKEWGASSPQFYQALTTNEVLKSVLIEFIRTGPDGRDAVFQTVTLTNASVSRINQFVNAAPIAGVPPDERALEEISFTFQKIEVENKDGKTMALDDWAQQ